MACNYKRNGCWKPAASEDIAVYGKITNIRQFGGVEGDMGDNWTMSYISKLNLGFKLVSYCHVNVC